MFLPGDQGCSPIVSSSSYIRVSSVHTAHVNRLYSCYLLLYFLKKYMLDICLCLLYYLSRFSKSFISIHFVLANVNLRSCSLYAIARPSVCRLSVSPSVCNVRAPYSGGSNFRQYFYGIRYLGYPLTSTGNFTDIVPGNPSAGGVKREG